MSVSRLPAFAIEIADHRHVHAAAPERFILRPTGDGWALVTPEGQVVFHGLGLKARRECLEFARDYGALSVLT
jgi:hypothetical protein